MPDDSTQFQALHEAAYDAFDAGQLREASRLFASLLERDPTSPHYHYMQGLVHKYLRDWPASLEHNRRSLALREEFDEASHWNAGIAATALGDWSQAREHWGACGIRLPPGEGPIDADFGIVSLRLNPWGDGETLFARRVDVVRAQLLNVPLPSSGFRCGDIVLHDGAATGRREYGQDLVPVFNALQQLEASPYRTFTVFVDSDPAGMQALGAVRHPGVASIEDWTESIVHLCLRCSHGLVHTHRADPSGWNRQRNLGVAALSREHVDTLLAQWAAQDPTRRVEGVESQDHPLPEPEDGHAWWLAPGDGDEAEAVDEGRGDNA